MKLEFWKGAYPDSQACQNRQIIADFETKDQMWTLINDFLNDHKFKSYYQRLWFNEEENIFWIDVGSHTEFFTVKNPTENLLDAYFKRE